MRMKTAAAVMLFLSVAGVAHAEEFYKGKRLTVMINYGPGGDVEGRLLSRHIGRLIDGNPNIVVQNIEGAGGLIGATWLGEIAPKDGTVIGHLTGVSWRYALNPSRFRVNYLSYQFLGYQSSTNVYYVRTDVEPGMRLATDLPKAKGLVSGGLAPDSSKDITIRIALQMLDVRHQHVTSYRSGGQARLALQQNEINFYADSPPAYRSIVQPTLIDTGLVIPIWHDAEGEGIGVEAREVVGLGIPTFPEYFRSVTGKLPSGQLWEAYNTVRTLGLGTLRVLALPPGSPSAAAEALEAALGRMNNDKLYAADAMKVLGFVPQYTIGPDINRQVRTALTVSDEMREFLGTYVKLSVR